MSRLDALHERATGPLVGLPATTVVAITAGDLRDLLAVAEQARGVVEAYDQAGTVDWTGELVDTRLRAALARLDAVTGGETS